MSRPVLTQHDTLIDNLLALRRVMRQVLHPVHPGEITPQQFWVLRYLWRAGPQSISDLADAVAVGASTMTTACQRLERAGLVTRERQAHDERIVLVMLTDAGRNEVERWNRLRRESLSRLLAPLNGEERDRLQHLIERMLNAEPAAAPAQADHTDR